MGKALRWLLVTAVLSVAPHATADPPPARAPATPAAPEDRSDAAEKSRKLVAAIQAKIALARALEIAVLDLISEKPVPPKIAENDPGAKQKLAAFQKQYDQWLASVAALQMDLLRAYQELAELQGTIDEAVLELERAMSDDAEAQRHKLEAERARLVSARNKISAVTAKLTAAKSRRSRSPAR